MSARVSVQTSTERDLKPECRHLKTAGEARLPKQDVAGKSPVSYSYLHPAVFSSPRRSQQHGVAMKVQVSPLPFGESADVNDASGVDSHPFKGGPVSDRRDDEPAGIFKADEPPVKQVIDTRCQEQAVFTIEAFLVRRIPPALACGVAQSRQARRPDGRGHRTPKGLW